MQLLRALRRAYARCVTLLFSYYNTSAVDPGVLIKTYIIIEYIMDERLLTVV